MDRGTIRQIKLRITEELRAKVENAARENDRSMNNEMSRRLSDSFNQPEIALIIEAAVARGMGAFLGGASQPGVVMPAEVDGAGWAEAAFA